MPVSESVATEREPEATASCHPEADRMIAALNVLTAPMRRTIAQQRVVMVALSAVLIVFGAVMAWNHASTDVYFASLGSGVQHIRPGEISETYLRDFTIHLTRLMGNVDGFSVEAAIAEMASHMAPELRVAFRALHQAPVQQLKRDDQWIYTPKIQVVKITKARARIGRRFVYTVELQARQVFGFLDMHSGYRDTPIVFIIEPRIFNDDQAGAIITGLTWSNMLRSDGSVAYAPEMLKRSS